MILIKRLLYEAYESENVKNLKRHILQPPYKFKATTVKQIENERWHYNEQIALQKKVDDERRDIGLEPIIYKYGELLTEKIKKMPRKELDQRAFARSRGSRD
jgi:hypothetical protein